MYDVVVRVMAYDLAHKCRRWRNRRSEVVDTLNVQIQNSAALVPLKALRSGFGGVAMVEAVMQELPECREETAWAIYV